jgi:hypothetical protein
MMNNTLASRRADSNPPIPQRRASDKPHPRKTHLRAVTTTIEWIWQVVNWKFNVDASSSWIKTHYFKWVFCPFLRFSYFTFDLIPPSRRDAEGRLWWNEWQGAYPDKWEAEQEAKHYPFGQAIKIPFGRCAPEQTVVTEHLSPCSPARVQDQHRRNGHSTVTLPKIEAALLDEKISSTDRLVEHFKSKPV